MKYRLRCSTAALTPALRSSGKGAAGRVQLEPLGTPQASPGGIMLTLEGAVVAEVSSRDPATQTQQLPTPP